MEKPKVTDNYLFYKKEYKQKNRSFRGVKSPSALWRKVYFSTEDYDDTKDECMEHYGFYYSVKAHNKICELEDQYEDKEFDTLQKKDKYSLTKSIKFYESLNATVRQEMKIDNCYMSETPSYAKFKEVCDLIISHESLKTKDYKGLNQFVANKLVLDMFD